MRESEQLLDIVAVVESEFTEPDWRIYRSLVFVCSYLLTSLLRANVIGDGVCVWHDEWWHDNRMINW